MTSFDLSCSLQLRGDARPKGEGLRRRTMGEGLRRAVRGERGRSGVMKRREVRTSKKIRCGRAGGGKGGGRGGRRRKSWRVCEKDMRGSDTDSTRKGNLRGSGEGARMGDALCGDGELDRLGEGLSKGSGGIMMALALPEAGIAAPVFFRAQSRRSSAPRHSSA